MLQMGGAGKQFYQNDNVLFMTNISINFFAKIGIMLVQYFYAYNPINIHLYLGVKLIKK